MLVSDPFRRHVLRYEAWFEGHRNAYEAEVRAVKALLASTGHAVEVGVGTGRFAAPLGIRLGVDPSLEMASLARRRGVEVVMGVGEALPFRDACFDTVLMVTTVCFLDDIRQAFKEARRILRRRASIIVGLVDGESPVGRLYQERREDSVFYRLAEFYTVDDVLGLLRDAGFQQFQVCQTLFGHPKETLGSEPVKSGYGEGSFVVVGASVPGG